MNPRPTPHRVFDAQLSVKVDRSRLRSGRKSARLRRALVREARFGIRVPEPVRRSPGSILKPRTAAGPLHRAGGGAGSDRVSILPRWPRPAVSVSSAFVSAAVLFLFLEFRRPGFSCCVRDFPSRPVSVPRFCRSVPVPGVGRAGHGPSFRPPVPPLCFWPFARAMRRSVVPFASRGPRPAAASVASPRPSGGGRSPRPAPPPPPLRASVRPSTPRPPRPRAPPGAVAPIPACTAPAAARPASRPSGPGRSAARRPGAAGGPSGGARSRWPRSVRARAPPPTSRR